MKFFFNFLLVGFIFGFSSLMGASEVYTIDRVPNVHLTDKNQYVSNPDGILNQETVYRLNQLLRSIDNELGVEIAVVAIKDVEGGDPRTFATDLFNHWKLGSAETNAGLLIQLVTNPENRSVVFETGYGLEGMLPDAICYRIQQKAMIPFMKRGDYDSGMYSGVQTVVSYIYKNKEEIGKKPQRSSGSQNSFGFSVIVIGIVMLAISSFIASYRFLKRPRVCPMCKQKTLRYSEDIVLRSATYVQNGLAARVYRCSNCGHVHRENYTVDRLHDNHGPTPMGGGGWFGDFPRGGGYSGGSWGGGSSGGGGSISRF